MTGCSGAEYAQAIFEKMIEYVLAVYNVVIIFF